MKKSLIMAFCLFLTACTGMQSQEAPRLRLGLKLAPASLGSNIAVQQHLTVERANRIEELDAVLEVDAEHIELVGLAFGMRVLRLHYDGKQLQEWRHAMLPAQVKAEDVLEDLQLTIWPLEAIRARLPAGWRIEDTARRRVLYFNDAPEMQIDYSEESRWRGEVKLDNLRYHYRLTIQSADAS